DGHDRTDGEINAARGDDERHSDGEHERARALIQDVNGHAEEVSVKNGEAEKIGTKDGVDDDQQEKSGERPRHGRVEETFHAGGHGTASDGRRPAGQVGKWRSEPRVRPRPKKIKASGREK